MICRLQTKFTTGDDNHVGDDYFLTSGDKIRYFLEEDAVKDGKLIREKQRAVNKIGHGASPTDNPTRRSMTIAYYSALHELDPSFRDVTLNNPSIKAVVRDLHFHKDPAGQGHCFVDPCR